MNALDKATKLLIMVLGIFKTNPTAIAFSAMEKALLAYQALCYLPSPTSPKWDERYNEAQRLLNEASKAGYELLMLRGKAKKSHNWLLADPMD